MSVIVSLSGPRGESGSSGLGVLDCIRGQAPDDGSPGDRAQCLELAVGSYDAAVVTKDAGGKVHENKDETATRHGAWEASRLCSA